MSQMGHAPEGNWRERLRSKRRNIHRIEAGAAGTGQYVSSVGNMFDLGLTAARAYTKARLRTVVILPEAVSLVGGSNQGLYRVKYR